MAVCKDCGGEVAPFNRPGWPPFACASCGKTYMRSEVEGLETDGGPQEAAHEPVEPSWHEWQPGHEGKAIVTDTGHPYTWTAGGPQRYMSHADFASRHLGIHDLRPYVSRWHFFEVDPDGDLFPDSATHTPGHPEAVEALKTKHPEITYSDAWRFGGWEDVERKGIWTGKDLVTWPVEEDGYPHHADYRRAHPEVQPALAYVGFNSDGTFWHEPTHDALAAHTGVPLRGPTPDSERREIWRNAYTGLRDQQEAEIEQATGLKSYRNQWHLGSEWPKITPELHRQYHPNFDANLARLPKWEPGLFGKAMIAADTDEPVIWGDIDIEDPNTFPELPDVARTGELHHEDVAKLLGGVFLHKVYIDRDGGIETYARDGEDTSYLDPILKADPRLHYDSGDGWRFGALNHNLTWTPGDWGKAVLMDDGSLHTFHQERYPTHYDYLEHHLGPQKDNHQAFVYIKPDGTFWDSIWDKTNKDAVRSQIMQIDPRLKAMGDDWHLSVKLAAAQHVLNWQPGTYGKAVMLKDGSLHTWKTSGYDGLPTHWDYLKKSGLMDSGEGWPYAGSFWIDPEGYVTTGYGQPQDWGELYTIDPRLKPAAKNEYNFSNKQSDTQHQQRALNEHRKTWYHLTDNPAFELDPSYNPENNTTLGGDWPHKGLFVSGNPGDWYHGHDYVRPFVAELEGEADDQKGYSGEHFIPAERFPHTHVKRVLPYNAWEAERYENTPYTGPDVREMTPEQHAEYFEQTNKYIRDERAHMMSHPCSHCGSENEQWNECQSCGKLEDPTLDKYQTRGYMPQFKGTGDFYTQHHSVVEGNSIDWQPNHSGKAIVLPGGRVRSWITDEEGSPHHDDMWRGRDYPLGYFWIEPDGRVQDQDEDYTFWPALQAADPRLKRDDNDSWNFSKVAASGYQKGLRFHDGSEQWWDIEPTFPMREIRPAPAGEEKFEGHPSHAQYMDRHQINHADIAAYLQRGQSGRVQEWSPNSYGWSFGKVASTWDVEESDFDPANSYLAEAAKWYTHSPWVGDPKTKTIYLGQPGVHHDDLNTHYGLPSLNHDDAVWGVVNNGMISVGRPVESDADPHTPRELADALHEHLGPGFSDDVGQDLWDFESKTAVFDPSRFPRKVTWTPGDTHKGYIAQDGTVVTWPDKGGPHHHQMSGAQGDGNADQNKFFWIYPDGKVMTAFWGAASGFNPHPEIKQAIPQAHWENSPYRNTWEFQAAAMDHDEGWKWAWDHKHDRGLALPMPTWHTDVLRDLDTEIDAAQLGVIGPNGEVEWYGGEKPSDEMMDYFRTIHPSAHTTQDYDTHSVDPSSWGWKFATPVSEEWWGRPELQENSLWHIAPKSAAPSILQKGLLPWDHPDSPGSNYTGHLIPRPNHVYLVDHPQAAMERTNAYKEPGKYFAFRIDPSKLSPQNISPDEDDVEPIAAQKGEHNEFFKDRAGWIERHPYLDQPPRSEGIIDEFGSYAHNGPIPPEAITGVHHFDDIDDDWSMKSWPEVYPGYVNELRSRASKTAHEEWERGRPGKAVVFPSNDVWAWNVDHEGSPHHWDLAGPDKLRVKPRSYFDITPDGTVSGKVFTRPDRLQPSNDAELVARYIGGQVNQGWNFSKVASVPSLEPMPPYLVENTFKPEDDPRNKIYPQAWESGYPGKAVVVDGRVHAWRSDLPSDQDPHHFHWKHVEPQMSYEHTFMLNPDGEISPSMWTSGGESLHPETQAGIDAIKQVLPGTYHLDARWHFGAVGEDWKPGKYGKGLILPDGEVRHWQTTNSSDGRPTHYDITSALGIPSSGEDGNAEPFWISPEGEVTMGGWGHHANRIDLIEQAIPNIKRNDKWHFGTVNKTAGETRNQLLNRAAQWPDKSEVVHPLDQGWSVRQPTHWQDIHRTGELMGNCWSANNDWCTAFDGHPNWPNYELHGKSYPYENIESFDPEEKQKLIDNLDQPLPYDTAHRWLADPDGIPRVAWYEANGAIHDPLGRHNDPPHPKYHNWLKSYADAKGLDLHAPRGYREFEWKTAGETPNELNTTDGYVQWAQEHPWQSGQHGKGMVDRSGRVIAWQTDPETGAPHHSQMIRSLGEHGHIEYATHHLGISPDGTVHRWTGDDDLTDEMLPSGLHLAPDDEWNFGARAVNSKTRAVSVLEQQREQQPDYEQRQGDSNERKDDIHTAHDSTRMLYHHSDPAKYESILKHGLDPAYDETGLDGIFLTTEPGGLAVDTDGLELEEDPTEMPSDKEWYVHYGLIPPERIQRMSPISSTNEADQPDIQPDSALEAPQEVTGLPRESSASQRLHQFLTSTEPDISDSGRTGSSMHSPERPQEPRSEDAQSQMPTTPIQIGAGLSGPPIGPQYGASLMPHTHMLYETGQRFTVPSYSTANPATATGQSHLADRRPLLKEFLYFGNDGGGVLPSKNEISEWEIPSDANALAKVPEIPGAPPCWYFSKLAAALTPPRTWTNVRTWVAAPFPEWNQGEEGKAFLTRDGRLYAWAIDEWGQPRHEQAMIVLGLTNVQEIEAFLEIGPDGGVIFDDRSPETDEDILDEVAKLDPRLHPGDQRWNFSKVASDDEIDFAEALPVEWPGSGETQMGTWSPGEKGKGIRHHDGTLYTWPTYGGEPHHDEVMTGHPNDFIQDYMEIRPDGSWTSPQRIRRERIEGDWNFSKTAITHWYDEGNKWGEDYHIGLYDHHNDILHMGPGNQEHSVLWGDLHDKGVNVPLHNRLIVDGDQFAYYGNPNHVPDIERNLSVAYGRPVTHAAPDTSKWSLSKVAATLEDLRIPWWGENKIEDEDDRGRYPVMQFANGHTLIGPEGSQHYDILNLNEDWEDRSKRAHGFIQTAENGPGYLEWYDKPFDHEGAMAELSKLYPGLESDPDANSWNFSKVANRPNFHVLEPEDMTHWQPITDWGFSENDSYQNRRPLIYSPTSHTLVVGPKDYSHDSAAVAARLKHGEDTLAEPYYHGWIGHNPEWDAGIDTTPEEESYGWYSHPPNRDELHEFLRTQGLKRDAEADTWRFGTTQRSPYQPGKFGKGLIHNNEVHLWDDSGDMTSAVHHMDVLKEILGRDPTAQEWVDAPKFWINPEGQVDALHGTDLKEVVNRLGAGYSAKPDGWNFKVAQEPDYDGSLYDREHMDGVNYEPWEQGSYGKGFIRPNGEVIHWKLYPKARGGGDYHDPSDNEPDHNDAVDDLGLRHEQAQHTPFWVDPNGNVNAGSSGAHAGREDLIEQALKGTQGAGDTWRFGAAFLTPQGALPFNLGKPGKAYVTPDGKVYVWENDERYDNWDHDVHHGDVMHQTGNEEQNDWNGAFHIEPNGAITSTWGGNEEDPDFQRRLHLLTQAVPGAHFDTGWNLSHTSASQYEQPWQLGERGKGMLMRDGTVRLWKFEQLGLTFDGHHAEHPEYGGSAAVFDIAPDGRFHIYYGPKGADKLVEKLVPGLKAEKPSAWAFGKVGQNPDQPQITWHVHPEDADDEPNKPGNIVDNSLLYHLPTDTIHIGTPGLHHDDIHQATGIPWGDSQTATAAVGPEGEYLYWFDQPEGDYKERVAQALGLKSSDKEYGKETFNFGSRQSFHYGQRMAALPEPDYSVQDVDHWVGEGPGVVGYSRPFIVKKPTNQVYVGQPGGMHEELLAALHNKGISAPGHLRGRVQDNEVLMYDGGNPQSVIPALSQHLGQPLVEHGENWSFSKRASAIPVKQVGEGGQDYGHDVLKGRIPFLYRPSTDRYHDTAGIEDINPADDLIYAGRDGQTHDELEHELGYMHDGLAPSRGMLEGGTFRWFGYNEPRGSDEAVDAIRKHIGENFEYEPPSERWNFSKTALRMHYTCPDCGERFEGDKCPHCNWTTMWEKVAALPSKANTPESAQEPLWRLVQGLPAQDPDMDRNTPRTAAYRDPFDRVFVHALPDWQPGQHGKGMAWRDITNLDDRDAGENTYGPWQAKFWPVDEHGYPHHVAVVTDPDLHGDQAQHGPEMFLDPSGKVTTTYSNLPEGSKAIAQQLVEAHPHLTWAEKVGDYAPFSTGQWKFASPNLINGGHDVPRVDGSRFVTAPWELGRPGKGLCLDGKLHLWAVEGGLEPHHDDIFALARGVNAYGDKTDWSDYHAAPKAYVDPSGEVTQVRVQTPGPYGVNTIKKIDPGGIDWAQYHPDLKVPNQDHWTFT